MKSREVPFSLLSIEAFLEMTTQCKEVISTNHARDRLLSGTLALLVEPMKEATLAIGSSQRQELTHQINEADLNRDRAFVGFRKHIEADHYHDWNQPVQKAAVNLFTIIERHGTQLHREGLTVQSALMTSLFEDLASEQAKAYLNTLKLTSWLNQIKKLQDDFEALYQQRNEIEAAKDIPTKTEAKSKLTESFSELLDGLHFLAVTQQGTYVKTNIQVEEIVNRIVASERGRKTSRENEDI